MAKLTIANVETFLTQPAGSRHVVVRVTTNEPGLYGLGCATFTQRHRAVQAALERQVERMGSEVILSDWELQTPPGDGRLVHVALESSRPISETEVTELASNLRAYLGRPVEVNVTLVAVEHFAADAP